MRNMPDIRYRAWEETMRLKNKIGKKRFLKILDLNSKTISTWKTGSAPYCKNLVTLGRQGADLKYILVGRRGGILEIPEEPIGQIGSRAFREVERIAQKRGISKREVMRRIGAGMKTDYAWKTGQPPSAFYLVRLHYMGANLNYIFTGRK